MTRLLVLLLLVRLALAPLGLRAADDVAWIGTTNRAAPLTPGVNDPNIAWLATYILQRSHFAQQPFDNTVSSRFLDRYLSVLDNQRLHFLESDLDEFEKYRFLLDDLTLQAKDTSPAYHIFNRFLHRMEQRVAYVNELLPKEEQEFTTDERIILNRKDLPRPKDLEEAKQLWRERLRYEILQEKLNKEKPEEIVKIITRRYARMLRTLKEFDSDDVLQYYLSALTHAYDPHSDYLGKSQFENFNIGMRLSLFGIGAMLRSEDGYCKIQELVPEGPAEKSKQLKAGDRIIAVAQGEAEPADVVDMKLNKVVELIRGPKGSEVRLTVIPADAPDPSVRKVVSLIRDEIKLQDQEAKARLLELPGPGAEKKPVRLGYIDLPSFYADFDTARGKPERKSTTTDVARLIQKLKQEKMDGLILDLRRNGGGSLEEAINLTGLFIKEGPVVQVRDSDGTINVDSDTDPIVLYDGPLIVLTSRFSASASEILAGALQDYGRALVIGDSSTHGKGTVQSLVQLKSFIPPERHAANFEPGALKVTIRKFYRASGASTQLKGVTPDIELPSVNNHAEVGEASLENPLPWDTVPRAKFEPVNYIAPHLAELKARSTTRVNADPDYAYLREDIEQFQKARAEKTVSLNEAQRLKEKAEAEARAEARKKEQQARSKPPETIYEIPLKLAGEPGLPPPLGASNVVKTAAGPRSGVGASLPTPATPDKKPKEPSPDDPDAEAALPVPAVDALLEEAKRILVDLIELTAGSTQLSLKNDSRASQPVIR
jgi:carboxyl-terminal processing protease